MKNIFRLCLLITVVALLCSCSANKKGEIKSNIASPKPEATASNKPEATASPKPEATASGKPEATASEVKAPEITASGNKYYYEPSVSVIEGTLITRMYYGPPGFGEDPKNDKKLYPYILKLDSPIQVIAKEGDLDVNDSDHTDVREVQVVPMNSNDTKKVKGFLNKRIKIQGTFFSAFTGYHHTDVLIQVDKILD